METLGQSRIRSFLYDGWQNNLTNGKVRDDAGMVIESFPELVEHVAHLAYHNRDHVMLFRGQHNDHRNSKDRTTIQPKIFRNYSRQPLEEWNEILQQRYRRLKRAERFLIDEWTISDLPDVTRLERYRNIRWAILQHYEICATPFLDVTHSLRVAASFAADKNTDDSGVLYVLAVPQISGAITASAEAELQILRLSNICPPSAARPHFQEGYLLGHYPDLQTLEDKKQYKLYEVDFGRRLLCKFRLHNLGNKQFWSTDFPKVRHTALYPTESDPLREIALKIKRQLGPK